MTMTVLLHTLVCWFHPCQYHDADTDAHLQAVAKAFHANRWIFANRHVLLDGSHHIDNAGLKWRVTSCYDILRGMVLHCRVVTLALVYIRNVHAISFSLCPEWAACVPTGSGQLSSGSAQPSSTQLSSTQLSSTQRNATQLNSTQPNSTQLSSAQLSSAHLTSPHLSSAQLSSVQLSSCRWQQDFLIWYDYHCNGSFGHVLPLVIEVSTSVVRPSGNCFDKWSAHNFGIKSWLASTAYTICVTTLASKLAWLESTG